MDYFDIFIYIIELISITSFAISGAMAAIRAGLDVFGVVIIGVTTSIGGGVFRDIILGINPPISFQNPVYATVSAIFALATFIFEYVYVKSRIKTSPKTVHIADTVLLTLDTVGLAIYTMIGITTAYRISSDYNAFLVCFVGVITGVGGGILRDLFTGRTPRVFVKHFYASPCIAGSILCVILWKPAGRITAFIAGAVLIIVLRALAAHFKWNLPHVSNVGSAEKNALAKTAGK